MSNLFSSTTASPDYNLFFGPREMMYINEINTELLEIVSNQSITYWAVEKDESDMLNIYGESQKKVTRNPVTVYCWVMLDDPEVVTGQFGTERKRRLEVYLHRDRLTEVGINPRIGDYVEWDNDFFEITYCDIPKFVMGMEQTKVGILVRALSVSKDVFDPRNEDQSDDREANSDNP